MRKFLASLDSRLRGNDGKDASSLQLCSRLGECRSFLEGGLRGNDGEDASSLQLCSGLGERRSFLEGRLRGSDGRSQWATCAPIRSAPGVAFLG